MNYGISIGGLFIVWSILLYNEMGITPLICATAITIAGIIIEHSGSNTNDDKD